MPNALSRRSQKVFEKLKSAGFRLTQARRNLVDYIISRKGHWTIQTLSADAQKKFKGIGVATIYRTVSLLQKNKLIIETQVPGGSARFEVASKEHHDHLTCLKCRRIFEFENDQIEALQFEVAKKLGFKLIDHRMELYGECQRAECRAK